MKGREHFKSTQHNYDLWSRIYDLVEGWGEAGLCQKALDFLEIKNTERILEIGSGTGSSLVKIGLANPQGMQVGLDLSFEMCLQAKSKWTRNSRDIAPGLINANAIYLPFQNKSFDAVLILFALEIIPAEFTQQALSECRRILFERGKLCVASMADASTLSPLMGMYRWSLRAFPEIIDCRPIQLKQVIKSADFFIERAELFSLWSLPVEIVLARMKR